MSDHFLRDYIIRALQSIWTYDMGHMARLVHIIKVDPSAEAGSLSSQLVAYAVASRLDLSRQSRAAIVALAGIDASSLSKMLRGARQFSESLLMRLELAMSVGSINPPGPSVHPPTVRRLAEFQRETIASLELISDPPLAFDVSMSQHLFNEYSQRAPRCNSDVLVEGEALHAFLTGSTGTSTDGPSLVAQADLVTPVERCIDRLLIVATNPFGSTMAASQLATALLKVVPELVLSRVEKFAYQSPLGFHALRVLSLAAADPHLEPAAAEMLIKTCEGMVTKPPPDPYPSRGLLVETLNHAQRHSTRASELLLKIADDERVAKRPRAAAAYFLAVRGHPEAKRVLEDFADSRDALLKFYGVESARLSRISLERPADLPITPGLTEHLNALFSPTSRGLEDLPISVREATGVLLREALVNLDTERRRLFLNAILAGGASAKASVPLRALALDSTMPTWIRAEAARCIGQLRDPGSVRSLLALVPATSSSGGEHHQILRHHAIWALGEIQRCDGNDADLIRHAASTREPYLSVRWAATFALGAMRDIRLRHTLTALESDDDALVSSMASWGVRQADALLKAHQMTGFEPLQTFFSPPSPLPPPT